MILSQHDRMSCRHIALFFCLQIIALGLPDKTLAQGSRFKSLIDDATRYLEQQGKAKERQIEGLATPEATPRQSADAVPPLPAENPRRSRSGPDTAPPVQKAGSRPKAPAGTARSEQSPAKPDQTTPEAAPAAVPARMPVLLPARNPLRAGSHESELAKQPIPPPPHPGEIEVPDWTEEQIEQAKTSCVEMLSGLAVDYIALDPVRQGRCGAPYPIRVSAIGSDPTVKISPPATLTCPMAAALSRWIAGSLQPLAAEHLRSPVESLRTLASYSCRNRYNNLNKRISEHALANALDIGSFTTRAGASVSVLKHWSHDAGGEQGGASATPATPPTPAGGSLASDNDPPEKSAAPVTSASSPQNTAGQNKDGPSLPGTGQAAPVMPEEPPEPTSSTEQIFLHALHAGACLIFGTTLGPEANKAHEDHFHLDMKERSRGGYCE